MPITYVGGAAAGVTGSTATNTDVDLSAGLTGGSNTGVSAGDLVIVNYSVGTAGTRTLTINDPAAVPYILPSGAQVAGSDNFDAILRVGYKFMPDTPDAFVRLGPTGATADAGAYAIQVWRGVSPTQPLDATTTTATGNNSARPNPPAITPVSAGAFVVCCAAGAAADMSVAFTFASAENLLQATFAATNDVRAAIMSRTWTSGAIDQAGDTTGSNTASDSWAALTMALRPAGSEKSSTPINRLRHSFQHLLVR